MFGYCYLNLCKNTKNYKEKILGEMVDIREDGSILLNMKYFKYATGLKMTADKKWTNLFGWTRPKIN